MKIKLFLFAFIALAASASAQFTNDINGRPMFEFKYTDTEGSPYLSENWVSGLVISNKGKRYEYKKLRYDAYKDELEYERGGSIYRLSAEISGFELADDKGTVFRNGFPAIDRQTEKSFYQVLYDGNTPLLKRIRSSIEEEKLYNSATITKRFVTDETFYLFKNKTLVRIKKDKKSILAQLEDKRPHLEKFIKDQDLKLSNIEDIERLLEEYDTQKAGN